MLQSYLIELNGNARWHSNELLVYIGAFIVLTKFDPNYFKLFFFIKCIFSKVFINLIVIFPIVFNGCCRCGFCVAEQPKTRTFQRPWHSLTSYSYCIISKKIDLSTQ